APHDIGGLALRLAGLFAEEVGEELRARRELLPRLEERVDASGSSCSATTAVKNGCATAASPQSKTRPSAKTLPSWKSPWSIVTGSRASRSHASSKAPWAARRRSASGRRSRISSNWRGSDVGRRSNAA